MISNNGRGTSYIYNTCFACCLGPLYNDDKSDYRYKNDTAIGFLQKHIGSDFLFSIWLIFILSIFQFLFTIYELTIGDDKYILVSFFASLLLVIGSGLFVYTSYPNSFFSRYWWCAISSQEDEQLEFGPELSSIMKAMMSGESSSSSLEETTPLI